MVFWLWVYVALGGDCVQSFSEACLATLKSKPLPEQGAILEAGCRANNAVACERGGVLYAPSKFDPGPREGLPHDMNKALALFDAGCALNNEGACWSGGMAYAAGTFGAPHDLPKAASMLAKACESSRSSMVCKDAKAVAAAVPGVVARKRSCEAGDGVACQTLGADHAKGRYGVPKDPALGYQLSSAGCRLSDRQACVQAVAYAQVRGVAAAELAGLAEVGCGLGDGVHCLAAARALDSDPSIANAAQRAAEAKRKACALGQPAGCSP